MFPLVFLKCTQNTIRSLDGGAAPQTSKVQVQKLWGGWAEGSSKVWFRTCSVLRACLRLSGTYPLPPPGPRFCLRARSNSAHPTPDFNRAEIKHHLPSTCLTSSLQEPSGKSQGFFFFFNVPFLNPAPKHHASSLSRVCKQTACCQGLSGWQKRSGPLRACNPSSGDTRLWEQPAPFWSP